MQKAVFKYILLRRNSNFLELFSSEEFNSEEFNYLFSSPYSTLLLLELFFHPCQLPLFAGLIVLLTTTWALWGATNWLLLCVLFKSVSYSPTALVCPPWNSFLCHLSPTFLVLTLMLPQELLHKSFVNILAFISHKSLFTDFLLPIYLFTCPPSLSFC